MIYFTADTHFGHANIIKHCDRPFDDVDTMDKVLIDNWNNRVHEQDTVYIVGDMFFRCREPEHILKQLKGKKHLILGNHDASWMKKDEYNHYFESIQEYLITTDGSHIITFCHYPLMTWHRHNRENSYMIFGHIHNDTDLSFWPYIKNNDKLLNAGCDINFFQPVTFRELEENNRIFKLSH